LKLPSPPSAFSSGTAALAEGLALLDFQVRHRLHRRQQQDPARPLHRAGQARHRRARRHHLQARQPVGLWQGEKLTDDLILTRILRLAGKEPRNANTYDRYVYIHGTNDELRIGQQASHGCVRLRTDALIELYDLVAEGTEVWIGE